MERRKLVKSLKWFGRSVGAGCLGAIVTVVTFAILLTVAWLPLFSGSLLYKQISYLLVSGVAFVTGGFVMEMLVGPGMRRYSLAFGLLVAAAIFGYVLGLHWWLLLAIPLGGLLGAAGGWLADSLGPEPAGRP
jgi:hypothetical protein